MKLLPSRLPLTAAGSTRTPHTGSSPDEDRTLAPPLAVPDKKGSEHPQDKHDHPVSVIECMTMPSRNVHTSSLRKAEEDQDEPHAIEQALATLFVHRETSISLYTRE